MTLLRPADRPMPLDMASLRVGPPLDAEETLDSRDIVAFHDPSRLPVQNKRYKTPVIEHEPETRPHRQESISAPGGGVHVRYMTPRQMLAYSEDLYAAGIITFEDYEILAFQPDLHPDFTKTIGALTGEPPQPDLPRDFIRRWENRLDYARRYYPANSADVRQAHRLLEVLKSYQRQGDIIS